MSWKEEKMKIKEIQVSNLNLEITHNLPIIFLSHPPSTTTTTIINSYSYLDQPSPVPVSVSVSAYTDSVSPQRASDLPIILPHPIPLHLYHSSSSSSSFDSIHHELQPNRSWSDHDHQTGCSPSSSADPLPSLDPIIHPTLPPISPILPIKLDRIHHHPTTHPNRSQARIHRNVRFSDPTPLSFLPSTIDHPDHSANQSSSTTTPTIRTQEPRSRPPRIDDHPWDPHPTTIMTSERAYEKLDPFPSPSPSLRFLPTTDSRPSIDDHHPSSIHHVSLPDWVVREYLKSSSIKRLINPHPHHHRSSSSSAPLNPRRHPSDQGVIHRGPPLQVPHHRPNSSSKDDGDAHQQSDYQSDSTIRRPPRTSFSIPPSSLRSPHDLRSKPNKSLTLPIPPTGRGLDRSSQSIPVDSRPQTRARASPRPGRVFYRLLDESEVIRFNRYHHQHPAPPAPPPPSRRSSTCTSILHPISYPSSSPPPPLPATHPVYPHLIRPDPRTTRSKLDHLLFSIFKRKKKRRKN